VSALVGEGWSVMVRSGAGEGAHFTDEAFARAGAELAAHDDDVLQFADVLAVVGPPDAATARGLRAGASLVGLLTPAAHLDLIRALRDGGQTAYSLDLVPRISRAQAMDALSSQSLVAGYRAVLVAADRLPRFFPLFMTAAGTVPPARVLVLGAGVAGLQAIATARRLGAVVEAYDVRAAAAEEVRSLGASFVELDLETQEGEGGYARAQSADFLDRQRELIGEHVAGADVVITTAAVPGRPAPRLVDRTMVERMRAGSVIVDLAAESGGNCELSRPGEEIRHGDVLVWGASNVPSQLPSHASKLYAANVAALLRLIGVEGTPDLDDEILRGCCVVHDGEVRTPAVREALDASADDRQASEPQDRASGEPRAASG
jgi:NAD(P) transhydrogenase subunit alpha